MTPSALHIHNVSKRFGATLAVSNVSLDVHSGEIVALLGENGAGKSTLIKLLAGIHTADTGRITLDETPLDQFRSLPKHRQPLTFIHQDLGLVEWMTVAENVAFGTDFPRRGLLIDWKAVDRQAAVALDAVGCDIPVNRRVSSLSRTEKSLLAIGRGLAVQSRILVLDEPTASLPAADVERLFGVLRNLRERGVGMIYVSHRLDEVLELSDRIAVMRDGKLIVTRETRGVTESELVQMIVGQAPMEREQKPQALSQSSAAQPNQCVLDVDDLTVEEVGPVSFSIAEGEIIGLVGLRGGGQEQVSRALFGMHPASHGTTAVCGRRVELSSPRTAIDAGISFVAADRAEENLALPLSVQENLFLNPGISRNPWSITRPSDETDQATDLIERFDVRPRATAACIENLSGGNQQKVILARWLNLAKPLIILEEPTAGVDIGARTQIYRILEDEARQGKAVLVCSTDFEEVVALCDRALVFRRGRIVAELEGAALSVPNILQWAAGGPSHSATSGSSA